MMPAMQAPSFMARIMSALNKNNKAGGSLGAVETTPGLRAIAPSQPVQIPADLLPVASSPFPMVEETETVTEEEVNPLSLYRAGSLSLPSRQYDIPNAPTMRGLPTLPQRDMAQDSRRGLDAAGIGALAGLLLGGGRGAVAGTLGAGRGYMAGRDRVAAQERQNYGDQLNQTLRLNSQDQQGFQNQMAGLSRQMVADNAADSNRARAFNANETANRGAFTANVTAQDRQAQTGIRREALRLKTIFDNAKTEDMRRSTAARIAKLAADAEFQGFKIEDMKFGNNLKKYIAENNAAQGKYRAETGRMMAENGFTLGQQRNNIAGQGLQLREQEIGNAAARTEAMTGQKQLNDQDQAQKELLTIQQGFPKVDAEIAKLKKTLRDGRWDTSGEKGVYVPWTPAEAQELQSQIQGYQAAKQAAAQRGQQLKLRAGATFAPAPETPRTPAAGKGKTAAVGVKLTPTGKPKALKDMTDAELKRAIAKKFGGS